MICTRDFQKKKSNTHVFIMHADTKEVIRGLQVFKDVRMILLIIFIDYSKIKKYLGVCNTKLNINSKMSIKMMSKMYFKFLK